MHPDLADLLAIAAVYVTGVVLPGPNFVATVHRAVSASRTEAMSLVAGIALVNMLWAAAAIGGITLLFAAAPWLFLAIKLAGAAYLLWMGIQLIRRAGAPVGNSALPAGKGHWRAFRAGLLTNLANAKAVVFYASIFAAATPQDAPLWFAAAVVGTVGLIAFLWYGSLALLLSLGGAAAAYRRAKPWIDRTCGAIIGGLGIKLAASS